MTTTLCAGSCGSPAAILCPACSMRFVRLDTRTCATEDATWVESTAGELTARSTATAAEVESARAARYASAVEMLSVLRGRVPATITYPRDANGCPLHADGRPV